MESVEISTLRLLLLGHPQVFLNENRVDDFVTTKAQALLIYLVLNPGKHARPRLAGLLWGESPEEKALRSLRVVLSNLRKLFPHHLEITRQYVAFIEQSPHWVDSQAFRSGLQRDQDDLAELEQAAALYRGDFLEGLYLDEAYGFEEWLLIERENLRQLMIGGLEKLADGYISDLEYPAAIRILRRLLELDPWKEDGHRQLMLLLARSGDLNAALAQFETCRHILAAELDVEPLIETVRLYERIRALRSLSSPALPPQPTPFVGRETEIAQLTEMLSDHETRLVTISGLGGVGKTRLALAVAERVRAAYLEGVYFVPLTAVTSSAALFMAIAQALGLQFQGKENPAHQVIAFSRDKEILLVLDNFEQLAGDASTLEPLLQKAPAVKLLVTSRERLNLRWEQSFRLSGLSYPSASESSEWRISSSVKLFQKAGARALSGFKLMDADRDCILQICRLVEGLPLALELAASWLRVQSCAEIASQIQQDLDTLSTSMSDIPSRQRSLRAIFEAAYAQLPPEAQRSFRQMAIFEGDFSAAAANTVAAATPLILNTLADAALLRPIPSPHGQQEVYFGLHPLVRQYAAETLAIFPDEAYEVGNRHRRHYLEKLTQAAPAIRQGQNQGKQKFDLPRDAENIRASWRWAVAHLDLASLQQAIDGLQIFYEVRGAFQEGLMLVQSALTRVQENDVGSEISPVILCSLYLAQSSLQAHMGQFNEAIEAAKQALNFADQTANRALRAKGKWALGLAFFRLSQYEEALKQTQAAFETAQKSGDLDALASCAQSLGNIAYVRRDLDLAEEYFLQAEAYYAEIDDLYGISESRHNRGLIHFTLGNLEEAQALFSQSMADFQLIGHRPGISRGLHNLGLIAIYQSKLDEATELFEEALALRRQMGDRAGEAFTLSNLAFISMSNDSLIEGYNYAIEALAIAQQLGDRRTECHARTVLGTIAIEHGRYSNAWEHYKLTFDISQSTNMRLEKARAQRGLGRTAMHLGLYPEAQKYLFAAYTYFVESGDNFERRWTAGNLAELLCLMNEPEAVQTYLDEILQDESFNPTIHLESYALRVQADIYYRAGDLARVEFCFARSAALWGENSPIPEPRTIMAAAYLEAGKTDAALQQVKLILNHLAHNPHEIGIDDPILTYLVCYRVLHEAGDQRASATLKTGYELLNHRATRIHDTQQRQAYLENIDSHRVLLEAYRKQ